MALRNQPYIPLYVQDFLTDEKLIECSAESTGVYIRLICILHKSEEYGKVLLKQKDKQDSKPIKNFASKMLKQMPYTIEVIEKSLEELLIEGVITVDGDYLYQKRMVKDNDISIKRAESGKKGGEKTQFASSFAKAKKKAKVKAKHENEDEDENEDINKDIIKNKYLDVVLLSKEEYVKLKTKYGDTDTDRAIEILNNAIMSKGYKYKSHYHTIIGWPIKEAQGGNNGNTGRANFTSGAGKTIEKAGRAKSDGEPYPIDAEF